MMINICPNKHLKIWGGSVMQKISKISISVMLIVFISFQSLVCKSQTQDINYYSDISSHWAKDEIANLLKLGYIKGVSTNSGIEIQPERNITRAEFLAVIVEVLKLKEIRGGVKTFSDVKRNAWYGQLIDIATSNDIVKGYPDGTFRPENNISRAEIAQLVFDLCKFNAQSETGASLFADVKDSDWFYRQVMLCKKNNIIRGYPDNTFRPLNYTTRAEAFCILNKGLAFINTVLNEEEIPGVGFTAPAYSPTPIVTSTPTPIATSTPTPNSSKKQSSAFRKETDQVSTQTTKPTITQTITPTITPTVTPTITPNITLIPTYSPTVTNPNDGETTPEPTNLYNNGKVCFIEPEAITVSESVYIKFETSEVESIKLIQCTINYKGENVDKSNTYSINDYKAIDIEKGIYEFGLHIELPGYRNEIEIIVTDLKDRIYTSTKTVTINIDTDNDGLLDGDEILAGTSRLKADTDGDGLSDYEELEIYKTNPLTDDTDNDGLSDWAELCPWKVTKENGIEKVDIVGRPGEVVEGAFYISPFCSDTDGDGLNDYYEVIELSTNPSSMFTLDNPFRDSDMDFDGDGLTNIEEFNAGTLPKDRDSDKDGLTDGAEVKVYFSDPINVDTDDDGIPDGKEVKNGSSPSDMFSFAPGVLDSMVTVSGNLCRAEFDAGISAVSDTLKFIGLEGAPNAAKNLSVQEVVYMTELSNIEGIIGTPLDITCDENITSAKLTFEISEVTLASHDIQNLKVFTVHEGKLNILDTEYDIENAQISATTTHFSIYGIIDIFKLIQSLMLDEEEKEGILVKGKADVVFVIDSTGSMSDEINNVIKNVNAFAEELGNNIEVRFGLIDYKDITADGEESTVNCGWYTDVNEFKKRVSAIKVIGGGDTPESAVDALEEARRMGFRSNANKFIILLTDAEYKDETRFKEVNNMEQEIDLLNNGGIITSVVSEKRIEEVYKDLYSQTGGIFADIYSDFAEVLRQLSLKIKEITLDGSWIRLADLSVVKLDEEPNEKDIVTDTDLDGIPDSVELHCKKIVSIGLHEVSVWDYFTNPVIKDTEAKLKNITLEPEEVKTGERFKVCADLFSPIGSKGVLQVVVQFRLNSGMWMGLGEILSNATYRDKYLMSEESVIFDGDFASVVRYEKFIEILEEGKHEYKISALLDDGTIIESVKHTVVVNAEKNLVWKGIDTTKTAEVSGVLDLNVHLQGEGKGIETLQICAVEVSKKREAYFELVEVASENSEYTLKLDTEKLENNKNYNIIALGLNSYGEVVLTTSLYSIFVKNVLPEPLISPESGEFDGDIIVSMKTVSEGAVIRYTLDGSEPTLVSSVYEDKNKLLISASKYNSVILKAAAFKGVHTSSIVTVRYSLNKGDESDEVSTEDDLLKVPYKLGDKGIAIMALQKALDRRVDISASEVMIKHNASEYTEEFTALTNALVILYQQQLASSKEDYPSYRSKIEEALSDGFGKVNQDMLDLLNDSDFLFMISKPHEESGKFKLNSSLLWEFVQEQVIVKPIPVPVDLSGLVVYLSPSLQLYHVGVGNYGSEYDRMSDIADVVQGLLSEKGIIVYRSNRSWRMLSEARYTNNIINDSNNKKSNIFCSIRTTEGENEDERGMRVVFKHEDNASKELAALVERKVFSISPSDATDYWRKGVFKGSHDDPINAVNAPTNSIEIAYRTNESDVQWVVENTREIGEKIAEGILEYLGYK